MGLILCTRYIVAGCEDTSQHLMHEEYSNIHGDPFHEIWSDNFSETICSGPERDR